MAFDLHELYAPVGNVLWFGQKKRIKSPVDQHGVKEVMFKSVQLSVFLRVVQLSVFNDANTWFDFRSLWLSLIPLLVLGELSSPTSRSGKSYSRGKL